MKSIGFIYDKAGNKKKVFAPVNANGKAVAKHKVTKTGKIPDSVGFSVGK